MSAQQQHQEPETSGRRTLINIVGFMIGTIVLLLVLKILLGM